jgi:hypothetical protein
MITPQAATALEDELETHDDLAGHAHDRDAKGRDSPFL